MSLLLHRQTPQLTAIDSRHLPIRQVAYLRQTASDAPLARITRQQFDAAGRGVCQRDPRFVADTAQPNVRTVYSLSEAVLGKDSVDAGWRRMLPGEAGAVLESWDGRASHWQHVYDKQLRPTAIHEQTPGTNERVIERLSYADNANVFAARNQCGQLIRHDDPAGTLLLNQQALTGEVISQTRRLLPEQQSADWPIAEPARDALLEPGDGHTSLGRYNPVGNAIELTDAAGHRQHFAFDRAGQLLRIDLTLKDQPLALLKSASYNAQGQLQAQTAGNGVVTTATFEASSGLMVDLKAVSGANVVQNLSYQYSPKGQITQIEDHTQTVRYFANQRVEPLQTYGYDTFDQLILATGSEVVGASLRPGLPTLVSPIDPSRLLNYTEHFQYDESGSLDQIRHEREGNRYTRQLRVAATSNRALPWETGEPEPDFDKLFDANGNLQKLLPGAQPMLWDRRNQLHALTTVSRDGAANDGEYYDYDSAGSRVRKVHIAQTRAVTHWREVRYLPNLEIRRRDNNEELHVISVQLGLGSVRCLHWVKGKPAGIEADQLRYSIDDHLHSCTLELDRDGALISYERYYPYGGTACWAARSEVEAHYKTIRYSGKEMDASGLVYYGLRYLAPWMGRWINPDPLGEVDGLNVYRMVGGDPVNYFDDSGGMQSPAHSRQNSTASNTGGIPMQALESAGSTYGTPTGSIRRTTSITVQNTGAAAPATQPTSSVFASGERVRYTDRLGSWLYTSLTQGASSAAAGIANWSPVTRSQLGTAGTVIYNLADEVRIPAAIREARSFMTFALSPAGMSAMKEGVQLGGPIGWGISMFTHSSPLEMIDVDLEKVKDNSSMYYPMIQRAQEDLDYREQTLASHDFQTVYDALIGMIVGGSSNLVLAYIHHHLANPLFETGMRDLSKLELLVTASRATGNEATGAEKSAWLEQLDAIGLKTGPHRSVDSLRTRINSPLATGSRRGSTAP
ncbi:RHS repeat-associated core domain protein containing protein [Pseudomonas sp. GM50]|uniref:RHS repeat-associated core domain-containing protein n=1 Tax=Pseudomonas sp. GM50 TaxID=1144332 RepID=UPI000270C782|nr:RHS repeat-associated core domain-containing protein [Pseudomonas sp. GM50]EJM65722.1 RHS repeat-associated core domain protein containing protein [Pseudomonas sp. GM50]